MSGLFDGDGGKKDSAVTLPSDIEAEKAILSSAMISGDMVVEMIDRVRPELFHVEHHGVIWNAIVDLYGRDGSLDMITLTSFLRENKNLDRVGGPGYIADLFTLLPTGKAWKNYVEICEEHAKKRRLYKAARELMNASLDNGISVEKACQRVEAAIAGGESQTTVIRHVRELLDERLEDWEMAIRTEGANMGGHCTGIAGWDEATMGCRPGTMHIIAGDSKAGKTTLALQMATFSTFSRKTPSAIFSMEMSWESLVDKMTCGHAGVSIRKLMTGAISPTEIKRLNVAIKEIKELPIYIINEPIMTPSMFRAKARRVKSQHHVSIVVIDYVQLMDGDDRSRPREQQVNEIGKTIKRIAEELEIAVMVISQTNDDGKLRESRSLKMHADTVTRIYGDKKTDLHTIEIEYNRDGPTAKIPCVFHRSIGRFEQAPENQNENA